jgi:hypothetical protein
MKPPRPFFGEAPGPEHLCAYVDGELEAPERQAIEAWLAHHPDQAAEVEAQRRLAALWQEAAPPEIDGAASDGVLRSMERAVFDRAARRARGRRSALRLAIAGLAAAVVLAVWVKRPVEVPSIPAPLRVVEEFSVVGPGDVEIQRLRKNHDAGFVGAEPLVDQPLSLATPRDVRLVNLSPDDAGSIPVLARDRDPNAPALLRPFELVQLSLP